MRRKVLLADDSLSIQKMFGLYLEKCDIDVITTSNGEMAVTKLPNVRPDLILADVYMPGRTGYEVCEYVKQHPDFKHIPVLLLTGKFEPYDDKEAKRVKADGHIVKPIAEQEFVSLIRTTLERTSQRDAVPPAPMAQTQILGSIPPPVAAKEPSALGSSLPKFHFGSPLGDPSSEVPPPTIKVSPSMLDDGRLPDLEPLLPLDAPPPAKTVEEATDFILDLPPPEQASPVLSYPEPPKTLSSPISRPTFTQMSPPDFGTTTARLDPSELPELLAATTVPPPAVDVESPLELDDAPLSTAYAPAPAPAEPPVPATEGALPTTTTEESHISETAAPVNIASPPVEPAPVASSDLTVTPPTQVAPPWSPPAMVELPLTTPLETQAETSSLSPPTSPLGVPQTSALLSEPIPPPDFLTDLVSVPAATVPPPPLIETRLQDLVTPPPAVGPLPEDRTDEGQTDESYRSHPTLATPADEPAAPAMPVFEVVVEDEPPVRGTDLLPDELLAIRNQQRTEAVTEAAIEPTPPPVAMETAPPTTEEPIFQPFTPEPIPLAVPVEAPLPPVISDITQADDSPPTLLDTPPQPASFAVTEVAPPPAFALAPLDEPAPSASEVVDSPAAEIVTAMDVTSDEPALAEPMHVASASTSAMDEPTVAPAVVESVGVPPTMEHLPEPAAPTNLVTPNEAPPTLTDIAPPPTEVAPTLTMPPAAELAPTVPDWSTFTLPQAVVDDIVRRVVAELSDRVIREIAWEVVPDLAELLIKKHLANGVGHRGSNA